MKYENRHVANTIAREIEMLEVYQSDITNIEEIKFGTCNDYSISLNKRDKNPLTPLATEFIEAVLKHIEKQIEEKKKQLLEL